MESEGECECDASLNPPVTYSASQNPTSQSEDYDYDTQGSQPIELEEQIELIDRKKQKITSGSFCFDPDLARNELARAVVLHGYLLSMVENIGFKNFMNSLQPHFKMGSRKTVKQDIFELYEDERSALRSLLESNTSRVAITTDMWSSSREKSYMSITAHFVDNNWVLQNLMLRFIYVPIPLTMEALAENLIDGLFGWNLETKLSTLTVDNCTTAEGLVKIVVDKLVSDCLLQGRLVHMQCCAQIFNLIVKDGLATIGDSITKIRDSVEFWSASQYRWKKFERMARQMKVPCTKKLCIDCETRWDSTYLMLQVALEYKDVFPKMKLRGEHHSSGPSEYDWDVVSKVCEKLGLFHKVTKLFSGRKYPTSHLGFIKIYQIRKKLLSWMLSEDETIASMAKQMFEKFDKYWVIVHDVLAVSVVLDPRFKMKVLEFYFPSIYGESANEQIERIRNCCHDLLQEYQSKSTIDKSAQSVQCQANSMNTGDVSRSDDLEENLPEFVEFLNHRYTEQLKLELDYYLGEPLLPSTKDFEDFDILEWWRTNGIIYPTLQLIARDFLAIPVSTVASESAFSTEGKVIMPHRSGLAADTMEVLMCTENWLCRKMNGANMPGLMKAFAEEDDVDDVD